MLIQWGRFFRQRDKGQLDESGERQNLEQGKITITDLSRRNDDFPIILDFDNHRKMEPPYERRNVRG